MQSVSSLSEMLWTISTCNSYHLYNYSLSLFSDSSLVLCVGQMDPIQEALDVLLGSPHLVLRDIGVGDATWEVLICPGDGGLGAEGYRPLASKLSAKVGWGETSEMLHFSQVEWMTSIPLLFGGAMYKVIMNMIHVTYMPLSAKNSP